MSTDADITNDMNESTSESEDLVNTGRVRGIFSTIAPKYDAFNALASLGIDRAWRRVAVRQARVERRSTVLDLCAGTGDLALAIARRGRPSNLVVTDFVPEMLEIARQKARRYSGPTKLSFAEADAQDLPFADGIFDIATVAFGVRNLPDRSANFAEVHRVLRRGGRYVILEFSHPTFAPVRGLYHVYLRHIIPRIGGALTGDADSFRYLNDSIRAFPTQPQLAAELRVAGFASVSWTDLTFGVVAVHVAVK